MSTFTIKQVQAAISYHLTQEPSKDYKLVSKPARALAEVFGLMIWEKRATIDQHDLTVPQFQALTDVPARVRAGEM